MHNAKRAITFINCVNHHTHRKHVEDVLKRGAFIAHLHIQTIQVLFTAMDLCLNARLFQFGLGDNFKLLYQFNAVLLAFVYRFCQYPVAQRIQSFKTKILQFVFHPVDAKPVGNRRIDFECFPGNAATFVIRHRTKGTHVVDTVSKFNQNDADIVNHCQQHLLKVGRLCLSTRLKL